MSKAGERETGGRQKTLARSSLTSPNPSHLSPSIPFHSLALSRALVETTSLFVVAVSFGSLASQISLPCYMSHASIPAALRAARGLPDDLVRISAGVEDAADLLHDLEAAFTLAAETLGLPVPPPRVDAALAEAAEAAGAGREAELERRIAGLERELTAAKGKGA